MKQIPVEDRKTNGTKSYMTHSMEKQNSKKSVIKEIK